MVFECWRVFVDTSALLAGLLSPQGTARQMLAAGELKLIELLISSDVLAEADRNIVKRFPQLAEEYRSFIRDMAPTLVEDPTREEIVAVVPWVGKDDAPILAAALKSKADFLVTWNTRDFMTPKIPLTLPLKIRTPGAFIEEWNTFCKQWPP
ncbi:MAG: PIN domain-containing protein [Elusimicrobia bacterium]|nr:PIN domain-containing protein [Elusimicrobiota bacterium]